MNASSPNSNPDDAPSKRPWHVYAIEDIVEELRTDSHQGLTKSEARRRLDQFGPNRVESGQDTPWYQILLRQFLDPLIYLLLIAAGIAFAFGKLTDTLVILAVLAINATIGFIQELRARKAIRSLAKMAAPRAIVIREGQRREIPSEEVVPGDLVQLEAGRSIPADLRLIRAQKLAVDESALTGESTLVEKQTSTLDDEDLVPGDRSNMAFSTTVVGRGQGQGIAAATAQNTELGHIATSLQDITEEQAPIQQKVHTLGKWIGLAIALLSVLVATVGWIQARTLDDIVSMIIAMTVAAIPEALPVVLTVTLAVGVRRMAERNAIIRSLPAVETLGSTTVIGSDKTGTLTMNQMTVKMVYAGEELFEVTGSGYTPRGELLLDGHPLEDLSQPLHYTLLAGLLANDVETLPDEDEASGGDPTEVALVVSAHKAGLDPQQSRREYPRQDVIPFESERQFMATLNQTDQGPRTFYKGAPEAIIERCSRAMAQDGTAHEIDRHLLTETAHDLARQGLRILAMAFGDAAADSLDDEDGQGEQELIFLGFQALEDPLRPEVKEAVQKTRQAGVRVLMLTGDHLDTARAIGKQLGLQQGDEDPAIEGRAIESMSDEELRRIIGQKSIYARVSPAHKLRIVEQLKSQGEIVAVTGDGVNDAPALRAAHLGVAMGKSGTDVAREASDMVLTDDNFASITAAVEEGRVVFNNIRKVTYFLLSTGVGLVLVIIAALFAGWPLPFIAVQVLWINLVTKGLQDVSLAFEPGEKGLLEEPPRSAEEGIFHGPLLRRMIAIGLFLMVGTLIIFWWALNATGDLTMARSIAMTQMVVFQFYHVFNCRSLHRSIFKISPLSNRFLFLAVIAALLAQIAILYVPALQALFETTAISLTHWGIILLVGTAIIWFVEIDKFFIRRRGMGPGLTLREEKKPQPTVNPHFS